MKSKNFDTQLFDNIVYSDAMCFTCKYVCFGKEGLINGCAKDHKKFTRNCIDYEREISICSKCKFLDDLKYSTLFESYVCGANLTIGFCRSCDGFTEGEMK